MVNKNVIIRTVANTIYTALYSLVFLWTAFSISDAVASWMARMRQHGGPSETSRGLLAGALYVGVVLLGCTVFLVFIRKSVLGCIAAIGLSVWYFSYDTDFTKATYEMLKQEPLAWARVLADIIFASVAVATVIGIIKMLCGLLKKKTVS